jgi:Tol biopolymer transport system component
MVWVRALAGLTAQPLAGTEEGFQPFWSPDSRALGFFADGKLKKIEASGGPPQTLCDGAREGGSWGKDGTIVFSSGSRGPLNRIPASGGTPAPATKLDESRHETTHRWPYFLPDGRHFLYLAVSSVDTESSISVASLDGKLQKLVVRAGSSMAYAPSWPAAHSLFGAAGGEHGYLLFLREQALLAQPFDAGRLELQGDAVPIAEQVSYNSGNRRAAFTVSENGLLAYLSGIATGFGGPLAWLDSSGKPMGAPFGTNYFEPRPSPDGKRVAVYIFDLQASNGDIWIHDLVRGVSTRFTFDPAADRMPVWSPDGSRIVFASNRKGPFDLYQKDSSGAGTETPLLETPSSKTPTDWSFDGRFLAYDDLDPKGKSKSDIWILPLFGDRKPFAFVHTEFDESDAHFSPDGRWIAYASNESRRGEVYVVPFSPPQTGQAQGAPAAVAGGKWQISTTGGLRPRWSKDGKELFYMGADSRLMAVEIRSKGSSLEIGAPRPLFAAPQPPFGPSVYEVTAGPRFLFNIAANTSSSPLTLVTNWTAALQK